MPSTFTQTFDTPAYKGTITFNTGLFINGQFVDPIEQGSIDVVNPGEIASIHCLVEAKISVATGKLITKIAGGTKQDVDSAVNAAQQAFRTTWGMNVTGAERGRVISRLANLIEDNIDEFAAIESLNTGKIFSNSKREICGVVESYRYFAGWADKIQGRTIEPNKHKLVYTRREPFGVCGEIVTWNFPMISLAGKIAPALATGNTVVLKASEVTPLSALKLADLLNEAGFPPGVCNIVNGYGHTVGQALSEHPIIEKISFTGSTLVGRKILETSSYSNLKTVTLELGGKSPNIIFNDANIDQAVKWAAMGIFHNMGQICAAGSRIFIQEDIYPKFIQKFVEEAEAIAAGLGDPFSLTASHGPLMSKVHFERVINYIQIGKDEGATLLYGGQQHGTTGYYLQPTIFTDCHPNMKIVKEEIFGPVAALIRFKDQADVIDAANDSIYGLACAVFTENMKKAMNVAHKIDAGFIWINSYNDADWLVPFGGFKQSGIGRELGEQAIEGYTQIKAIHVNLGTDL